MSLPDLSLEQVSAPLPVALPDGRTRQGWDGDWITGNHRRETWEEYSLRPDRRSRQMADDLFIEEGEERFWLFVAKVPAWSTEGESAVPAHPATRGRLTALMDYLDRVKQRYSAVYKMPCLSGLQTNVIMTLADVAQSAGPLPPVPGDGRAPVGSPKRGPDPVQIKINAPAPTDEAPPPIGRLATHTRGGVAMDHRAI